MTVVARWEWRIFGDGLGAAERRLRSVPAERVEEADELYLLGAGSDASVKIRNGQIDGKRLLRVDPEGLEQWSPVVKAAFPVTPADLGVVLELLGVPADRGVAGAATLEALLALVEEQPELCAVPVFKHREHYTFAGCMAECSELRTPGGGIRTIAVESPQPERVSAAVDALGLSGRPAVSVPRALKAMIGFGAPRAAVIDIGTNSVKFHIGERGPDGRWRTVVDRAEITRLGEGLSSAGRLTPQAIERTVDAVELITAEARRLGASRIVAVGTAGLRIAPNADELVDATRARTGVTVEVLSGQDEARLAYAATLAELEITGEEIAVFDTGGGSTQFTFAHGTHVDEQFSVDVGAVRLTERFGLDSAISSATLHLTLGTIEAELAALRARPRPDVVIAMGGATTNLAAVKLGLRTYDPDRVHGTVLERADVERQIERFRVRSAAQRREIAGLQPARAEVILAGACVVRSVLVLLDAPALRVSDRGLRHGLLVERFGAGSGTRSRPPALT